MNSLDFDTLALAAWNADQSAEAQRRAYKTGKHYADPRREKQRDYHKQPRRYNLGKEEAWVKKNTRRKFRRFLKRNLENEAYYRVHNRDYRTGGWLTW